MLNLPLHPLIVHVPLVFAGLAPIVIAVVVWGRWRGRFGRGGWITVLATTAVLAAASFVAVKTGQNEEETVEEVVADAPIHTHEERAEAFLWLTAGTLGLVVLASLMRRDRIERAVGLVALAASLVTVVGAIYVGHSGATLVYRHGAAGAYVTADSATGAETAAPESREHRDDDER
jgi:uncharacterized membrane protein